MFRFFNVKNDNSADSPKIIWDEEINILQPEVVANLDKLRNGEEIVLPLKLVAMEENEKEKGSKELEGGTNEKEEESMMNRIFSFFAQCLSKIFADNSTEVATSHIKDSNEVTSQNPMEFKTKVYESENYSSDMPLLEEHQKELSQIWSTLKPNSIITGRRTMRKLSEKSNDDYTLKKIKVGENEYYILHQPYSIKDQINYHSNDDKKLEQVYATLTQSLSKTPYTGYFFESMNHGKFTFYYTSEIDAHWDSQKFEIKACKDKGKCSPYYHVAYRAAIQCFYSGIKECIYGFYNDTHVTLKLFTYSQLVQIAKNRGWNIETAKSMFHSSAAKIIKFIKENDHKMLNKTIKITTKNNEMVFKIQE